MPNHCSPSPPQNAPNLRRPPALQGELHYRSLKAGAPDEAPAPAAGGQRPSWLGSLKNYGKWWLVFAGIYASSSVCPFCGKPGCPVGPGAAGLIGLVFAWLMTFGQHLRRRLQTFLALIRG